MMKFNNTLFGTFATMTFADVYDNVETWLAEYTDNGIPTTISTANAKTLYYLLYARYGNSTMANFDVNQFKYKVWSIVFMYGPTWEKRLTIQNELRNASIDDLREGSIQVSNNAYSNGQANTTTDIETLEGVNSQYKSIHKNSKASAYTMMLELLETDVTKNFIDKFASLFIKVVQPYEPLLYTDEQEDNEDAEY